MPTDYNYLQTSYLSQAARRRASPRRLAVVFLSLLALASYESILKRLILLHRVVE